MHHNSIFMKLYRNVYQVKIKCLCTTMVAFLFFVSELWPFDCVLCLFNLYSCTPHYLVTAWDIFKKFNRNVYYSSIAFQMEHCFFNTIQSKMGILNLS